MLWKYDVDNVAPCYKYVGKAARKCDIVLTDTDAESERRNDLLYEVKRVRRDGGVGDGGAVVERHHVALSQPRAQLTQHLLVPVLTEPHHLNYTYVNTH